MSREPSVDVIVPCYNYGAYVEGCVASILDNPGVAVRVLLLDDASTDDTPEVGARLAAADSRVTYRRHHQNHGHIATYNEGLAWVTADYVLLISADDLLTSGALSRAVAAFERHPEAVFVHGQQLHFSGEPTLPDPAGTAWTESAQTGTAFITDVCAQAHNPVATPTVVVRTTAHRSVGGYEPTLPHTADLELWLRLAVLGAVVRIECLQALKRQHARNMQLAYVQPSEGDVLERLMAFERFFDGPASHLNSVDRLRAQIRESLGTELIWRAATAFDAADRKTCDRLMDIASTIAPRIDESRAWRRMEIKRRLGAKTWALFRGIAGLRHRPT